MHCRNNFVSLCVTGAGASIPYWDFAGNTIVTSTYIRLTSDQQGRIGGLWNNIVRLPLLSICCHEMHVT